MDMMEIRRSLLMSIFNGEDANLFDKNATPYQSGKYISSVSNGLPVYTTNDNYNVYKISIKPNTKYEFGLIKATSPIWATVNNDGIVSRYEQNNGGTQGTTKTFISYSVDAYLLLSVAIAGTYKCDDILQVIEK